MEVGLRTVKWGALLALLAALAACGGSSSGGTWCCTWDSRRSACGGGEPYSAWEARSDSFNEADYYISPQEHCQNMATSDTSCAGSCCVYVENANGRLQSGACP